ncbi:MAG TPA: type III pantothenate kinase [Pseudomonadota bacterium]|nr:type III pantothenate kinase [Rhodanobacteraceae bacterium]MBP9154876.1 type III pantothenate kinase [Xanthomonadales bacterium]HQW81321.1 type III pantothenate kinase [Pseudomonadota bacterium]
MDLLFDLGNTRMKIACRDAAGVRSLATLAWDASDFLARWHDLDITPPERIAIANVTRSHRLDALQALLAVRFADVPPRIAQTEAQCGRLHIAYAQPQKLGVDRFLALLAASQQPQLQLLVGLGTAMTIDALAANGQHLGGLIVPGVRLMRKAMTRAAPNVDWHDGAHCIDFASDTASALESGIWCALAGAVERSAQRLAMSAAAAPLVLLHGGDAPMLAAQLALPVRRDALLVMRGLAAYLDAGVAQSRPMSD